MLPCYAGWFLLDACFEREFHWTIHHRTREVEEQRARGIILPASRTASTHLFRIASCR